MAARRAAAARESERPIEAVRVMPVTKSTAPAAPLAEPPPPNPGPEAPAAAASATIPDHGPPVVAQATEPQPAAPSPVPAVAQATANAEVLVYYFHRTLRCQSCLQIEEWARQAVDNAFYKELAAGTIEWRTVNMESEENKHFVDEYNLKSPSLVLIRPASDQALSWKNLEGVWDHLGDYTEFAGYVTTELTEFLESP